MKPQMVFFDCDGVINLAPVWEKIHRAALVPSEVEHSLFEQYYQKKITYKQWIDTLELFYKKNLTKKDFDSAIDEGIRINPEIHKVLKTLNKTNIPVAIISSGLYDYVKKIADRLSIKTFRVNAFFRFNKQGRFTRFDYYSNDPITKVHQIKEICDESKIDPKKCIFVGDSYNDIKAFEFTEHGLLYKNRNADITKLAWKLIDNLEEIINIINENG